MKKLTGYKFNSDMVTHATGVGQGVCPVCDNKKYVLKTVNRNGKTTMYAKEACPACFHRDNSTKVHDSNAESHSKAERNFNGTGYLRNRKRRRKHQ
jgi:hypothetical protein